MYLGYLVYMLAVPCICTYVGHVFVLCELVHACIYIHIHAYVY